MLHEVGLRPILSACANCKRAFGPEWRESYFSVSANGLVCRDCEMSFPDKIRLTARAARCLADLKQIATLLERRETLQAQVAKMDYVCRKLQLQQGQRTQPRSGRYSLKGSKRILS